MKKLLLILMLFLTICSPVVFAETQMEKTNRMMLDCINNGLVYKADAKGQIVWVNEAAWRSSYYDDKKNIANFFLIYTKTRNSQAAFVDIRSATSNKVIGTMSPFGYKDK